MVQENDFSEKIIGKCEGMRRVFQLIRKVAASDVPVLVTGASGTGKELVAQTIHQRSKRIRDPFITVNCGAIPRELLESEFFGHEKGAFTGAHRTVMGKFELANKGTLFLDEIGELPLELQVKLLRALQEYSFERVGGRKTINVDFRLISATNTDMKGLISEGRFREDLYYRLDVVNIELPPLKDRGEDILVLANIFLKRYSSKIGKEMHGYTQEAITAMKAYTWPGNIRELINRILRAVVMAEEKKVSAEHLGLTFKEITPEPFINGLGLKEAKAKFEASIVASALKHYRGNVQLAAKALKTSRSAVYHLIMKYDLAKPVSIKRFSCA